MNTEADKKSLYDDVLVGDFFPESWLRRFSSESGSFWQDILNDENRLHHLYVHSLRDNARILRTPTTYCTGGRLEEAGLKDKLETICNLSISKARQAREEMQADILICGCIGPVKDFEQKSEGAIREELEELAVYLSDFEADTLLVQNIADRKLLEITLESVRRVTGQPLAVFFEGRDFSRKESFSDLESICNEFGVELCGIKISADSDEYKNIYPDFHQLAMGVLLENPPKESADLETLVREFEKKRPVMILGGESFPREKWRQFLSYI